MKIKFILNNRIVETETHPAKSLLDFLRKDEKLTAPKEVCKEGDCGACTVLLGSVENGELVYRNIASCVYPVGNVSGKHVVTLEGLNEPKLNFIQKHFAEEGAAQCGFCTPGYIASLTNYFISNATYNETTALMSISGNVCRCTGYGSIKRAVKNMVTELRSSADKLEDRLNLLAEKNVIPSYFKNIKERLQALGEISVSVSDGRPVGGGTDLLVQIPEKIRREKVSLLALKRKEPIGEAEGKITFDAETTFAEFGEAEIIKRQIPNFDSVEKLIASPLIRNVATIAGNVANASPIGDFSIILLALNAELVIEGKEERIVPLRNFYKGYKQLALEDGEIIKRISFPVFGDGCKFNFEKVSKRTHLDIASVNSAIKTKINEEGIIELAEISAGGVAPVPKFLSETSAFLKGKKLNNETLAASLEKAQSEVSPISDVRGSAEYKRKLLDRLIIAHFVKLYPDKINVGGLL